MIELKKVTFEYPDNRFSLGEINLHIEQGEFISILGPNGSGKSTLLRLLSGFLTPATGKVKLFGKELSNYTLKERAKRIAFVSQSNVFPYPFTVYEIVAMGRNPYLGFLGYEKTNDSKIISEILAKMEIEHLANEPITRVSGGEAQRAFIARALAQQSQILLLDEANVFLDVKHQISIFRILKELNEENNITVVFVSHDFNLAAHFSKRALLMKDGKILKDDKVENVLTKENIKDVFEVESEILNVNNSIAVVLRA